MVTFYSNNPAVLLASFKEAIRKGHVETWSEVNGDFTHTPAQWREKAWFRPTTYGNELRFSIVRPQNAKVTTEVYAVYHGRLVEAMLAHFDSQFTAASTTAMPAASDRVAA